MKKQKTEKLQLNRETLQQLQDQELKQVAGGTPTQPVTWDTYHGCITD